MAWDQTSPERAAQVFPRKNLCRPFRADRSSILDPGFQSPLSRALPPWALLLRAFGATSIDLSLTRMPFGAGSNPYLSQGLRPGLCCEALSALRPPGFAAHKKVSLAFKGQ